MNKAIFLLIAAVSVVLSVNVCSDQAGHYYPDQFWLAVKSDCHRYVICVPSPAGYVAHPYSCGALFWNQELKTCVTEVSTGCVVPPTDPTSAPTGTTTVNNIVECYFVVNPANDKEYKPMDNENMNYTTYQSCSEYFHFSLESCTCLLNGDAPPTACDGRSFLYFKFDGDLRDSSCTRSKAIVTNGQVNYVDSPAGKAVVFSGTDLVKIPLMRGIFLGHYVTEFSVSFFFRTDNYAYPELIFDNRDNSGDISILLGYLPSTNEIIAYTVVSGGEIRHAAVEARIPLKYQPTRWTHVTYVYQNGHLSLTIDGTDTVTNYLTVGDKKTTYTIDSVDQPMGLAGRMKDGTLFIGMVDELRVFKRTLSTSEIFALSKNAF